jgi:hypothetical protein
MAIDLSFRLSPGLLGDDLFFSTGAISIVPVAGAELLANADFGSWSADNPSSWSIEGESGADPEVTQRDSGQAHADTKTSGGAANFYATGGSLLRIYQSALAVGGFYKVAYGLSRVVAGALSVENGTLVFSSSAPATVEGTMRAVTANVILRATGTPRDLTVDSVSAKLLSNMEQVFNHAAPYGDFSAALTIGSGYQGGVVFNWLDADNHARLILDRLDNKVYLFKRVGGTVTTLGSWSATYIAGKTLVARRHKDGTIDVIYNGATLASGLAATGLNGRGGGPFATDSAGVTVHGYSWDARRTT